MDQDVEEVAEDSSGPENFDDVDAENLQNIGEKLSAKLSVLKSTVCPCPGGMFIWDCEVCLEILRLDLILSWDLQH